MITATNLTKQFKDKTYGILEVDLQIQQGEFVFLMGSSGAGKTTLMNLMIGRYKPTDGELYIHDLPMHKLKGSDIYKVRRTIGVVFQDFKLLQDRTIYENIALSYQIRNIKPRDYHDLVSQLLNSVGLPGKENYFPVQLSGGELQRVAIARALASEPDIILADEPTGDLDLDTSWEVLELFEEINQKGKTIVMATHNHIIVEKYQKRVLLLEDGRIINDTGNADFQPVPTTPSSDADSPTNMPPDSTSDDTQPSSASPEQEAQPKAGGDQ
jgi:cell division transport system ATP-binding protein